MLRLIFAQRVLGPDMPLIARVQAMHIRKVSLKVETAANLNEVRRRLREVHNYLLSKPEYKSAVIYYDVD